MNKQSAILVFESLASGVRLDVYRLLVKQGPQGLVAGEISRRWKCHRPIFRFI
jgi:hypothetical protein